MISRFKLNASGLICSYNLQNNNAYEILTGKHLSEQREGRQIKHDSRRGSYKDGRRGVQVKDRN
jgi:hypothetical protein